LKRRATRRGWCRARLLQTSKENLFLSFSLSSCIRHTLILSGRSPLASFPLAFSHVPLSHTLFSSLSLQNLFQCACSDLSGINTQFYDIYTKTKPSLPNNPITPFAHSFILSMHAHLSRITHLKDPVFLHIYIYMNEYILKGMCIIIIIKDMKM